ncbi:Succinate dehydrogenase subunit 5 [Nymphaea thermarum]|nr:Succinate dehydrogenase subunit 5 [Nymphaea thermarum]
MHCLVAESRLPFAMGLGSTRLYSTDISQLPQITDPDVLQPFKDLMAASWDELPDAVVHDAKNALAKNSKDKQGQEALTNVFRAALAVEQFGGTLVSLRMELDDISGALGLCFVIGYLQNVGPLPDDLRDALSAAYRRYVTYLDAFGTDEAYLKKKVEMELGTKMIHLKMRCSNFGSDFIETPRLIFLQSMYL